MEWLVSVLIWLGADHEQDSLDRAKAAGATAVAHASMHEREPAPPLLIGRRPPVKPAPAPCPGGKCPPVKPAPKK